MNLALAKQLANELKPLLVLLKAPEPAKIVKMPKRVRKPGHKTRGRPKLPMTEERKKRLREANSRKCHLYYLRTRQPKGVKPSNSL